MTCGRIIKAIRVYSGMTQYELAKRVGISANWLHLIESRDSISPDSELLEKILEELAPVLDDFNDDVKVINALVSKIKRRAIF